MKERAKRAKDQLLVLARQTQAAEVKRIEGINYT
jgi:hypothetical protein